MAILLRFPGGAGYITIPEVLKGAATFDLEWDFSPRVIGPEYAGFMGSSTGDVSQRHTFFMFGGSRCEAAIIFSASGRCILEAPPGTFSAGSRYVMRLVYNGAQMALLVNGTQVAWISASGVVAGAKGITEIGAAVGVGSQVGAAIDLYRLKITVNGVLVRDYDADLSGGSGVVLPDRVNAANNGQQVGAWPANNAEWINDGPIGATVTGGGVSTMAAAMAGGGSVAQAGGAVASMSAALAGGGAVRQLGGAALVGTVAAAGSGFVLFAGGAVALMSADMVGGGAVIVGPGPAVIVDGGAALTMSADMVGGGATVRASGSGLAMSATLAGGGAMLQLGGGPCVGVLDSAGGGAVVLAGGAALTMSALMVGGGALVGPGYKPVIVAPATMINGPTRAPLARVANTIRAPYTAITKTHRAAQCRL